MVKMSYDVVKRWVNEAQEAASSDNIMVQVGSTKDNWTEEPASIITCNLLFVQTPSSTGL